MRKYFAFFGIYTLLTFLYYPIEIKSWKGTTNKKGEISIQYQIPKEKPVFLQGYIFFRKNWRTFPVFYNDTNIWADLGKYFKNQKYQINLLIQEIKSQKPANNTDKTKKVKPTPPKKINKIINKDKPSTK